MNESIFYLEQKRCAKFVDQFSNRPSFVDAFRKKYDLISAYHATNLDRTELGSVRKHGLQTSSSELLQTLALSRFLSDNDPPDLRSEIKSDIENYISGGNFGYPNRGEINFGLNKEQLMNEFYHYLLFGPETLLPLADQLKQKYLISFRQRMMNHGDHVVINVKIPTINVDSDWIEGIYEYLVNDFPESSLVYYKKLPADSIIKIQKVRRPEDPTGFQFF